MYVHLQLVWLMLLIELTAINPNEKINDLTFILHTFTIYTSNVFVELFSEPAPPPIPQELVSTTQNTKLRGILHHSSEPSALDCDNPYISTTNYHHRRFTKDELSQEAKKDATTYWQWEGQPKAWGYSTEGSGRPRQLIKKEDHMRDRTWFKQSTTVTRIPEKLTVTPNRYIHE